MYSLLSAETLDLTPELAQEFRDMEASPTERELDTRRVGFLQQAADEGRLVTFHWSQAQMGNQKLRMNGQHSSTMLCGLNGKFPQGLKVHLDTYKVDNGHDLALLFRQFDARQSNRTPADVAGAYQMIVPELHSVPRAAGKIAVEGVAWYRTNIEGVPVGSGDARYELFHQTGLHGFIKWIGELLSVKTPELKRVPVIAAAYATFSASESGAAAFWGQVARGGVDYEEEAPATVLDAWLKESLERDPRRETIKPGTYFNSCIYCWNSYRGGKETISGIRYDPKKGNLTIHE